MTKKKLLILGATSETCKLVQRAEQMGIETYVVDPYENAHAKKYASHPILLNCFDVDGVCALVENEHIDGILPGCADILIPVYEEVCRKTGKYCYVNKQLVDTFNNKKGLKEILTKYGLSVIKEYSKEDVESDAFAAFPVFLKPVDNNSSKGMYIANDREEFETLYDKSLGFSRSKTVLIEEYKNCDDFFIGYFAHGGQIEVAFTGDRFVIAQEGVGSITSAITYPSKYNDLYFRTVHQKMLAIFKELNFENGICAIQGFVEDDKIMFYDPALRITGGQEYMFVRHFSGVDELEALIDFSINGSISTKEQCNASFEGNYACNLTFSVRPCTLGNIDGIASVIEYPGVLNVTQEHHPGDVVNQVGTAQQNIARMHIFANSKEELRDLILYLQKTVIAYDNCGLNVMLNGFDPIAWYNSKKS